MKRFFLTLFFLNSILIYSQNFIPVQGYARDATGTAIGAETVNLKFEILDNTSDTPQYEENKEILTDDYGVFNHKIGQGTNTGNNYSDIDWSKDGLKLKISIIENGTETAVGEQTIDKTPLARYADNGVPTGSILPWIGNKIYTPDGWILCEGQSLISIPGTAKLRALIGSNAPDLRGMFLRGVGTNGIYNNAVGASNREFQEDNVGATTGQLTSNAINLNTLAVNAGTLTVSKGTLSVSRGNLGVNKGNLSVSLGEEPDHRHNIHKLPIETYETNISRRPGANLNDRGANSAWREYKTGWEMDGPNDAPNDALTAAGKHKHSATVGGSPGISGDPTLGGTPTLSGSPSLSGSPTLSNKTLTAGSGENRPYSYSVNYIIKL